MYKKAEQLNSESFYNRIFVQGGCMAAEKTPGDDFGALSKLLNQSRNEADNSKVRSILDSGLSLEEKIQKIQEIDKKNRKNTTAARLKNSMEHAEKVSRRKGIDSGSAEPQEAFVTENIPEEQTASARQVYREVRKNQVDIKAFITPKSFLAFFFSDYRDIKQFGIKTQIYETGAFGIKLNINPNMGRHFSEVLQQKLAKPLKDILQELLKTSWLVLDKKHYNMLVMLNKHCEALIQVDFLRLDYKNKKLIDKLSTLERSFLLLHHKPEVPSEIIECFDLILDKDPKLGDTISRAVNFTKQILSRDLLRPSLYNLLLGLNIVKNRSMIELKDLILPVQPLIYLDDYDCSAQIKKDIDQYLNEVEKKLGPNLKELEDLIRTRVFLPADENGNLNFAQLEQFYSRERKNRKPNFTADQENMIRFTQSLAGMFDESYSAVLSEQIEVQDFGKVALFASGVFSSELDRLRLKEDRLEKLLFQLPSFPRNRFINLKSTGNTSVPAETEALHEIADIISILHSAAKRIAMVMRNRMPVPEEENSDWKPINNVHLQKDQIAIPFENKPILAPQEHLGKTVLQVLQEFCYTAYQAAAFCFDNEINVLLKKEKNLKGDLDGLLEIYKRIATGFAFDALRNKYKL